MYNELKIIEDKQNGMSIKNIVEKHNIKSVKTIYDIIQRKGIKRIANKKYDVNSKFFKTIDTEKKAYWLGFLYADGYVRMKNDRSGELRLKLKQSDRNHIELFNNHLNSNYPIKDITSKVIVEDKEYNSLCSSLSIYNTEIVQDLFDKGCVNNKTQKIRLPEINDNLMKHFIRGYFDGDGSISSNKKFTNNYTISMVSNKIFIKEIKKYLEEKIIIEPTIYDYENYSTITISKIEDVITTYNYLYEESNIYLKRKKIKFNIQHKYKISTPNNEILFINNLTKFCKENNLNYSNMYNVVQKLVDNYKGWKIIKNY